MSKDIWHKKTERPKKLLHCTRLIITKWGSVYSEKDIDNGAFIETDWAYLDDLLALETELERTRKALEIAVDGLEKMTWGCDSSDAEHLLKEITALKQKDKK